ncbi:hypothetical protein QJS04_geneDACA022285 [Acorus gramineus]|uniref:Uncharacterized protein n=1 Tax=Acorus gramineus TaxID=55184 RepID=A0AAV9BBI6_ACOGR|nr:hypothetical protein QJS04_geneDACA022285 [Acorus gramineus]
MRTTFVNNEDVETMYDIHKMCGSNFIQINVFINSEQSSAEDAGQRLGMGKRWLARTYTKMNPSHSIIFDDAPAYGLRIEDYTRALAHMRGYSKQAAKWVEDSDPNHWANALFSGERYGEICKGFGHNRKTCRNPVA